MVADTKRFRNVLFDLDGTLTDPAEGIVRCIQHSLTTLQIACPPTEELIQYIGPPLRELFISVCGFADAVLIERAVAVFRERFSTVGLFENIPYSEVPSMLERLDSDSYRLFVATSKPQVFAERILEHFELADHFEEIHGNDLEGSLDDKSELLRELLMNRSLNPKETIMVGDRKYDVIAAKSNGLVSIGVTYGYGSSSELTAAGVDYLCHSPTEVVSVICSDSVLEIHS
jgi:phosphoglycolate phosphatase